MKKLITTTVALVTTLSLALLLGTGPVASSGCNPVNGHLVEDLVPGPGFQTAGRFWGAIQGTYEFTLTSASPTGDPTISTVVHFVGHSTVRTRTGDLRFTEAGALDTAGVGNYADLMTITGGTGAWATASGQIHLMGFFSGASGHGEGDYRGEVCGG